MLNLLHVTEHALNAKDDSKMELDDLAINKLKYLLSKTIMINGGECFYI